MKRLKELINKHSRWQGLTRYISRIEIYSSSDFEVAIGNAKSLIECICKTILDEQEKDYTNGATINKLLRETLRALNIQKDGEVSKFAQGVISASQHLGELRNKIDTSSHGQSLLTVENNPIEELTLYFLINSIETIACFLIEFYEIEHPRKQQLQEKVYADFQDLNDYLDD